MTTPPPPSNTGPLAGTLAAVARVIDGIRPEQWSAPTPCTGWNVHDVVEHLVVMNRVFTAILAGRTPPARSRDPLGDDPAAAYLHSAAGLQTGFEQPGVLERVFTGPLGDATGAERMHIRLYDLLAHGWDLAEATGQRLEVPDDLVEESLVFVRHQLQDASRAGRFNPAQPVPADAPPLDRLAAFLGRPVGTVGQR